MFTPEDDAPSDPRRYRRSLVPLQIEDAEAAPSLGRRLARLFRRKKKTNESASDERCAGIQETPPPAAARKDSGAPPDDAFPESLESENGDPGQNL
jgi:hypothetical protein